MFTNISNEICGKSLGIKKRLDIFKTKLKVLSSKYILSNGEKYLSKITKLLGNVIDKFESDLFFPNNSTFIRIFIEEYATLPKKHSYLDGNFNQ